MKKHILKPLLILSLFMSTSTFTYAQPNYMNEPLVHVITDEIPTQSDENSVGILLTLVAIAALITIKAFSNHNESL